MYFEAPEFESIVVNISIVVFNSQVMAPQRHRFHELQNRHLVQESSLFTLINKSMVHGCSLFFCNLFIKGSLLLLLLLWGFLLSGPNLVNYFSGEHSIHKCVESSSIHLFLIHRSLRPES